MRFVGRPILAQPSELRYVLSCSVHRVKGPSWGKKSDATKNQARPARCGQRWKIKDSKLKTNRVNISTVKTFSRTKCISHYSQGKVLFHPIPKKAHKSSLVCEATPMLKHLSRLKRKPSLQKTTQVNRWGGCLYLNHWEAGTVTLTLYYLGDISFARLVVTGGKRISNGRQWPSKGHHQSPGVKDLPNCQKRQGVREGGQGKDQKAFDGVICYTIEPAKWNSSGVWNLLVSKVRDFKKGFFCVFVFWFFFNLGV